VTDKPKPTAVSRKKGVAQEIRRKEEADALSEPERKGRRGRIRQFAKDQIVKRTSTKR
jgi:hypothetical protein